MYIIACLLGIAAMIFALRGAQYENSLRRHHAQKRFSAELIVQEPGKPTMSMTVRYAHYIIGRWKRRSDLHIEDRTVSRPHAILWVGRDGRFYIRPVFHRRKGKNDAYYSQVYINEDYTPAPVAGYPLNYSDTFRLGNTIFRLEKAVPQEVRSWPKAIVPMLTAGFIMAMYLYISGAFAKAEMALPASFTVATLCLMALLIGGSVISVLTKTHAISLLSAITTLLMLHNSYMIYFETRGNYLLYMLVFIAAMAAAFVVLRRQAWLNATGWVFYAFAATAVGLMVINLIFGQAGNDQTTARLWLKFGPVSIQPGELVKPLLALLGAMSYRNHKRFWIYVACSAFTCGALLILRDFGNIFVIFLSLLVMIFLLYDNFTISLSTIAVTMAAFFILLGTVTYAQTRFDAWGNAMTNTESFQQRDVITSAIMGGFSGLGPEKAHHATRIYAAAADIALPGILAVYGMPFLLIVLLAYCNIVMLPAANTSPYPMGNLLLIQAALVVFLQVLLNLGGPLDILPFTGINAPMISSGGSSMLTMGIFMGAILASFNPYIPKLGRKR